jgi:hypothetical protein
MVLVTRLHFIKSNVNLVGATCACVCARAHVRQEVYDQIQNHIIQQKLNLWNMELDNLYEWAVNLNRAS